MEGVLRSRAQGIGYYESSGRESPAVVLWLHLHASPDCLPLSAITAPPRPMAWACTMQLESQLPAYNRAHLVVLRSIFYRHRQGELTSASFRGTLLPLWTGEDEEGE